MAPQLIYIALIFMSLGLELSKHGEEKKGKHNFWTKLIVMSGICFVLYMGGFFNPLTF